VQKPVKTGEHHLHMKGSRRGKERNGSGKQSNIPDSGRKEVPKQKKEMKVKEEGEYLRVHACAFRRTGCLPRNTKEGERAGEKHHQKDLRKGPGGVKRVLGMNGEEIQGIRFSRKAPLILIQQECPLSKGKSANGRGQTRGSNRKQA